MQARRGPLYMFVWRIANEIYRGGVRVSDVGFQGFIARGASGSVHRAVWRGMRCAVKRFGACEQVIIS